MKNPAGSYLRLEVAVHDSVLVAVRHALDQLVGHGLDDLGGTSNEQGERI